MKDAAQNTEVIIITGKRGQPVGVWRPPNEPQDAAKL